MKYSYYLHGVASSAKKEWTLHVNVILLWGFFRCVPIKVIVVIHIHTPTCKNTHTQRIMIKYGIWANKLADTSAPKYIQEKRAITKKTWSGGREWCTTLIIITDGFEICAFTILLILISHVAVIASFLKSIAKSFVAMTSMDFYALRTKCINIYIYVYTPMFECVN